MYAFQYQKPATPQQAREWAESLQGQYLAGGQSLVQAMKLRMSNPSALIDLSGLPDLQGIQVQAQTVRVGAMTTHAHVAQHLLQHFAHVADDGHIDLHPFRDG